MKHLIKFFLVFFLIFFIAGCDAPTPPADGGCGTDGTDTTDGTDGTDTTDTTDGTVPAQLVGVNQYIQATIRIEGDITVYFDPYQFPAEPHDADVIFITHSHADHFSSADISKVRKADTIIVAPESMAQNVANLGISAVQTVVPGSQYSVKGLSFETTFAYNSGGSIVRHPKSSNWVGYIVTMGDTRYYIAGDTDFIPEMESVSADVAFLPVGGGSSMSAEEAATAAAAIKPAIAVPIHYGVTGSADGAEQFVEFLPNDIAGYIFSDNGDLLP